MLKERKSTLSHIKDQIQASFTMKARKFSIADLKSLKESTKYFVPKEDIIREGYLFKHSSSMLKQWRARYIVLTNTNLYCYKHMADFKAFPLEVISFKHATMALDDIGVGTAKMSCIKLSLPILFGKKNHIFGCHNAENRDEWMTAILEALANQRMEKREQEKIAEAFDELDGLAKLKSKSVSMTDLSKFGVKQPDRPKSAEFSWMLNVNMRKDNPNLKHMRRAKALSLVENINLRNDFFLH